jgi:hypothetical protein
MRLALVYFTTFAPAHILKAIKTRHTWSGTDACFNILSKSNAKGYFHGVCTNNNSDPDAFSGVIQVSNDAIQPF